MLRKVTVLMVVLVFISTLVSASEADDEGAEKTYTLDATMERLANYAPFIGLNLTMDQVYDVASKYFPEQDSTITQREFYMLLEDLRDLERKAVQMTADHVRDQVLGGILTLTLLALWMKFIFKMESLVEQWRAKKRKEEVG